MKIMKGITSATMVAMICATSVAFRAMAAPSLKGLKPNIVLIMPDDISYGSIQIYGGKKPSPNIDALYKKGMRFEDFHVSPTCSPARASLLTGRHECYAGVTHTIMMRDRLSLKSRTIADMLKAAGYTTGIFGKWHLGDEEVCYIPPNVNHGPHIPPVLPDGTKGDSMINLDDNVGKMMNFLDGAGLSENSSCKPYHELYRRDIGQERFDEAMRLMTWTGGKNSKRPKKFDK